MVTSEQIDTFSRFFRVSRETIQCLKKYENMLVESNKKLNLIGKSTIKEIWTRHFLDSYQVIDFIDKNDKSIVDMGSGAGFPGLILALGLKEKKIESKITLIEKSPMKAKFLRRVINELDLKTEVLVQNIFDKPILSFGDVFIARAFKPLGIILQLMHSKSSNWKKIFVYLGKTGKEELLRVSKVWDIEYNQRMSVTSKDSFLIEIVKLEKKN
jgi:16S rRNA (guanine527-N7)-methyltransferase